MADIRIFTHYSNMSGSGTRCTKDIHTVRTRQLILQNQDGTYPTQGHFLSINSSRGLVGESYINTTGGGTTVILQNIVSTGDVQLDADMQVSGVTEMSTTENSGTLSVGNRTFLRGTDISGTLLTYGDIYLVDLTVSGDTQLRLLDLPEYRNVDGSCNFGSLYVQGNTVLNNVTLTGTANIGNITINNIDISGYAIVEGPCNVDSLNVQGDSVLNDVIVTGTNNIPYNSFNADIPGYLNAGSCSLDGDTTINGTMRVVQNTQCSNVDISGYLNIDGPCSIHSLNVHGETALNNLVVNGTMNITPTFNINDGGISGYLHVDGSCNIDGNTFMGGTLRVGQISQFKNVDNSGYLFVDGSCNLGRGLNVVGTMNISDSIHVNNTTLVQSLSEVSSEPLSTNDSTISITSNGYMYGTVTSSSINMHASGLPLFGYIVWRITPGVIPYSYVPTFPIISSSVGNIFDMGLPDNNQITLFINCIVVAPYTTIVFNTSVIDASGGFTCKNNTSPVPTTFMNNGTKILNRIISWYVYRYNENGLNLDNGTYFRTEAQGSFKIT